MTKKKLPEILIVDDDPMILLLHKLIVQKAVPDENIIHQFEDGKKTLEFILDNDAHDKNYLILLDINMPVMDGWQFLDQLCESSYVSSICVAMVTSSIDYRDKMKANEYDLVFEYIEKPLKVDSFKSLLEEETTLRNC